VGVQRYALDDRAVTDTTPNYRPSLTLITGRPGSGKTTLARSLSQAIRCPLISRDEIKEGLVNSLATSPTDDTQRHANDVFFETLELLLNRGVTLIAEAAFQHKIWSPRLASILPISITRIIVCSVDPHLARSRHIQRSLADPQREHFHADPAVQAAREGRQFPIGEYDPPKFNVPTLLVDTTDGYRPPIEQIIAFTQGAPEPANHKS
jgi:predicted kinase